PRPDRPALEQWSLREPGQLESCLRLLRRGSPAVLVMRVGSKLEQELTLLERVHWLRPHARVVVVGDLENEPLAGLAWDFGASFVLFPPQPRSLLPGVVAQLMRAAIARQRSTAGAPASVSEDESDEDDVADEP